MENRSHVNLAGTPQQTRGLAPGGMLRTLAAVALGLALGLSLAQPSPAVVADGLNAPMGVLVGADGSIYVADSGTGGDLMISMPDPESGETMEASYGMSARVIEIAADGTQTVLGHLPSLATPFDTSGAAGLAWLNGTLYATASGWIGVPGVERPAMAASIVALSGGEAKVVADTWAFEEANNPDTFLLESHPYRIAPGPDGSLWVAEAGGNMLLKVSPDTGDITLVTVFDGLPGPFENPARGGAKEMDPVPTGLVVEDDGSVLVAFLPGGPFPPGSSKIVRVAPDGSWTDVATGLTMTTDLRRGPDGALYAVQFGMFTVQGPVPGSGALVRVGDAGPEVVVPDLMFPTSVDFTADGDALVTVGGVGAPGSGQLLRFAGVATP